MTAPILYRISEACRLSRRGRTAIYEAIGDGTLPSIKVGRHRLIRRADLAAYIGIPERDLITASSKVAP